MKGEEFFFQGTRLKWSPEPPFLLPVSQPGWGPISGINISGKAVTLMKA